MASHAAVTVPAAGSALLLIDVVNDLDFDGSEALIAQAEPMARRLAALKRRASAAVLTGIAGNICVLFTADDAYMREFHLFAPADCIVSNTAEENAHALRQIQTVMKGNLAESTRLAFRRGRSPRARRSR